VIPYAMLKKSSTKVGGKSLAEGLETTVSWASASEFGLPDTESNSVTRLERSSEAFLMEFLYISNN